MSWVPQRGVEHGGGYFTSREFDLHLSVGHGFVKALPVSDADSLKTEEVVVLGQRVNLTSWRRAMERAPGKPHEFEVLAEALTAAGHVQISIHAVCRSTADCNAARGLLSTIKKR
jgi:hypothetical protein